MTPPPHAEEYAEPLNDDLTDPESPVVDDGPPILNKWSDLYALVLACNVLLILAFYFISRAYAV